MNIRDRQGLRQRAVEALSRATYSPAKLALLHTGAAVALSLVLTALNFVLSRQMDGTGGLSGMGLRSVLSTAQTMLSFASMVVMPFWEIGFVYAAIRIAREKRAEPESLLQGFRRFGPVLRLMLLQALIYVAILFLSFNISTGVFILTPFSQPMAQMIENLSADRIMDAQLMEQLSSGLIPLYCIFGVIFAVFALPVTYRLRMAQYVIMDDPKIGALAALGTSNRLMRYNRWALFRLDLTFWWFFGLQLLSTLLGYGDLLAEALGVSLPISEDVAFFVSFALHAVCQLAIAWWFASRVAVTYATAYDTLRAQAEDAQPPLVKNLPWDFLPGNN